MIFAWILEFEFASSISFIGWSSWISKECRQRRCPVEFWMTRDLVVGGLEALVLRLLIKKNATLCECQFNPPGQKSDKKTSSGPTEHTRFFWLNRRGLMQGVRICN